MQDYKITCLYRGNKKHKLNDDVDMGDCLTCLPDEHNEECGDYTLIKILILVVLPNALFQHKLPEHQVAREKTYKSS